jgi:hypothetical protein
VEDVLACVNQKTQGLYKELNKKIDEMQVDLQAVKTSNDTETGSLKDNITVTKKDLQEATANTRNDLQEALSLMFLVEAQTTKAEIRTNEERTEAKIGAT